MSSPGSVAELPVAALLARLSAEEPAPNGPLAAAVTCAAAACLVEEVARAEDSPMATARMARTSALRDRALALAEVGGDDATIRATTNALAIASSAAQLTSLAAECVAGASDAGVADAVVAAELADGACRAAVHVVRIGLRNTPQDPRRTEATGLVSASSEALQDAFAEAAERSRPE